MNRQERVAYQKGWDARCADVPFNEVVNVPLRENDEVVIMPGEAYRDAITTGYLDAVCKCGHVATDHEEGYGCHQESEVDGVECPCLGFESESLTSRTETYKRRNKRTRKAEDAGPEA